MVRTQIQLTEAQARGLKRLASRERVSVAELIRRSVNRTLAADGAPDEDEIRQRAIAAIGSFRSDRDDVSENHDDYLVEAYQG